MSRVEARLAPPPAPATAYAVSLRGAFTVAFLLRSSQMGTIAIIVPYLLDRGVELPMLGTVMVCSAFGAAASNLITGRLVDRFGAWRALVGGCAVAFLGALAFIMISFLPAMAAAYLFTTGGMAAAGNALRTTIGLGTPAAEHERTFGRFNSVGTAGALVGPILVGLVVIDGTAAAPWFAVVALGSAGIVSLLSRRAALPVELRKDGAKATESTGSTESTEATESTEDAGSAGDAGGTAKADGTAPAGQTAKDPSLPDVLRSIGPVVALVSATATMYGVYAVLWGPYLRELGAADPIIPWSFTATMLPVVLLSPHASKVLPNTPRWLVVGVVTGLLGVLAFAYALTTSIWMAIVISVVEGVLMAISVPLTYALITKLAPPAALGRSFGVASASDSISSGIGTSIAGVLIAAGGVAFVFQLAGAYCVLGTALAMFWWWRKSVRR
ncbi:MFS transporter [Streptosporangium longisporum]|uniref:Major facilitator superfamily (MFS) profile domain-containing protein n=1 Tax=Streptosporangium longisporum TaxID=46187 RepID=A0ABN3XS00_9ACTN